MKKNKIMSGVGVLVTSLFFVAAHADNYELQATVDTPDLAF